MKRTAYILLALAALLAAACSKPTPDGPTPVGPDSPKSYIFFEAGVLDVAQTKASLITDTSLPAAAGTAFGVIGYYEDGQSIFSSYSNNIAKVYRKEKNGEFQYDDLAPWMGIQHTFYAFYPYAGLNGSVSVGSDNVPYISYTQPTVESSMADILGAYKQVTNTNAFSPVVMQFQHLLWAFNLTITNSQSVVEGAVADPAITIRRVTLALSGFPQSASLKLDSDYTVIPGTTDNFSYDLYSNATGETIAATKSKTYGPLLFIPVTGLNYQVIVEYTTASGVAGKMVYPAEGQYKAVSTAFTHGKAYNLTVTKTNDKFFVGEMFNEGPWEDANITHTFQ